MKKLKGSKVKTAKPADVVKPLEPKNVNTKQSIQGQMGKAQGYLGKFAGQAPEQNMLKNKAKTKKRGTK